MKISPLRIFENGNEVKISCNNFVIISENRYKTGKCFLKSNNSVFEFTEVWADLFKKEKKGFGG